MDLNGSYWASKGISRCIEAPQVALRCFKRFCPKGDLSDLNGFFGTITNPVRPLNVLSGFLMNLKGFSEASRSPFWTLMDPLGP